MSFYQRLGRMIDAFKKRTRFFIGCTAFDADGALRGGGQPIDRGEPRADPGFAKPSEPGSGEKGGIDFARRKLRQTGRDIAPEGDHPAVRPGPRKRRPPPPGRGGPGCRYGSSCP